MFDVLEWLTEPDVENPGVRYWTLVDLVGLPRDASEVVAAREALMQAGQVPAILAAQDAGGYWEKPGHGYSSKYRGTVWSVIYLAQLGADPVHPQVRAGGEYVLQHSRAKTGVFTCTGTPSGNIHCLNGNLGAALLDLGFGGDERLVEALDLMARYVTGHDIIPEGGPRGAPRYLKSGACAPGFCCSANNAMPCAWGAVKVLRALSRVPAVERSAVMQAALDAAVDFLFSVDPASAGYPAGYSDKPSRSWFRFGFPVFYVADVLQTVEALTDAGHDGDPRLESAYRMIQDKAGEHGRYKLEYSYGGKTWADVGQRGEPNKWVTLRALRVLRDVDSG
jgi:hypothetical protein